jgi:hypothetical protein
MRSRRAISASRWLFAIAVSTLLHAAVVGGWFTVKPTGDGQVEASDNRVNAPDDDPGLSITLREPPQRILHANVTPSPKPVEPPARLPESVKLYQDPSQLERIGGTSPGVENSSPPGAGIPKLHGRAKAGKTVVYLLDCSSSMGPALSRAKAVLRESLKQLGPDAKFQLVAYNGGAETCFPASSVADTEHVTAAERWLENRIAEGRSDHLRGFREALAAKPDAVFVLTDADDFEAKEVKTLAAITPANVFVSAAIFGRPPVVIGSSPLEQFTRQRYGSVRWFPGP